MSFKRKKTAILTFSPYKVEIVTANDKNNIEPMKRRLALHWNTTQKVPILHLKPLIVHNKRPKSLSSSLIAQKSMNIYSVTIVQGMLDQVYTMFEMNCTGVEVEDEQGVQSLKALWTIWLYFSVIFELRAGCSLLFLNIYTIQYIEKQDS